MTTLRVAGAQIVVTRDVAANGNTIERAIDLAAGQEAEILLTPEGSLSGYTHEFDQAAVDDALKALCAQARGARLGLALGTCFVEPDDAQCYNQVRFYNRDGDFLGFHAKTLRCANHSDPPKGELNHYGEAALRTFDFHGTCIAGLICNDLWANPGCTPMPDTHLTQQLSKMGARVIFHAVNGGRSANAWSKVAWDYHGSNLRMRARAGKLWIVTVDNCAPIELPCSAPCGVINPEGDWAAKTQPQGEQFFVHTIDMKA